MDELVEYMVYSSAAWGNQETMIAGKLVAINFFNEKWLGRSLPLHHFQAKASRERIKREHVNRGTEQRQRRLLYIGWP